MRILEYIGLDASGLEDQYRRTREAIARRDFRAAGVKKLIGHDGLYRARLDRADRLIFSLIKHGDQVGALMLEVIRNHDYGKSRFLRGATIDEGKLREVIVDEAATGAVPVRYLHPERASVQFLDKPLSFDEAQDAIFRMPAPQIIVGGAGSGKTALALEKLKTVAGEALYVTESAYLARNARDLYYSVGFEREEQEVAFLSYRELIESVRIPGGREVRWRDFDAWFVRQRQAFKGIEAHQAFEEIRGVLAAQPSGVLSREDYCALGVRRSIFGEMDRERVYDLFERYRAWLGESGLFDAGLLAHEWRSLATQRYDFLVIDEVQDLTAAQLALILKTLKHPGQFLLCGDSNQIVHPNFFSWSAVKSLFWSDPQLAARQELRVLAANFRNGPEATRLANTLLKVKHRRFGSIDRESNFLVQAVAGDAGKAVLLPDTDAVRRELETNTGRSTQFAVLVLREEDKAAARQTFSTPLLFSVQEAKGLEYDNIVLFRFISNARREFAEIASGVSPADLVAETLDYARARDKTDKSLEIYKFFVNALYVALTRGIRNVYLVESDRQHPLLRLLGFSDSGELHLEAQRSSLEDWQKEARKLELQGKQEQADSIRRTILKQTTPPPWPVFDEAQLRETMNEVFRARVPGEKRKARLYEWAAVHEESQLTLWLSEEANYGPAWGFNRQRAALVRKHLALYSGGFFQEVLRQCDEHGLEHRTLANLTPLMAACAAGNVRLVESLLERGANPEATDHYGRNALHWAMLQAFRDGKFAGSPFAPLYEHVAPVFIDLKAGDRLVRIDRHTSEYFLLQTLWALFKTRFTFDVLEPRPPGFNTAELLEAWKHLPASVLRPQRNRREHISAVLSRNEVERDYAYNRGLFRRLSHGWYQINPTLSIRCRKGEEESWQPVMAALNLPLIKEFAEESLHPMIDDYLAQGSLPPCAAEFGRERAEHAVAYARAIRNKWGPRFEKLDDRTRVALAEFAAATEDDDEGGGPKWGTPEAREREIRRLQRRNDRLRRIIRKDDG